MQPARAWLQHAYAGRWGHLVKANWVRRISQARPNAGRCSSPAATGKPPRDPNARSWSVHFIGGKRMERLGTMEAVDGAWAIDAATALFGLDNLRRKRLAVRSLGK
jgi:hypothetical protein